MHVNQRYFKTRFQLTDTEVMKMPSYSKAITLSKEIRSVHRFVRHDEWPVNSPCFQFFFIMIIIPERAVTICSDFSSVGVHTTLHAFLCIHLSAVCKWQWPCDSFNMNESCQVLVFQAGFYYYCHNSLSPRPFGIVKPGTVAQTIRVL